MEAFKEALLAKQVWRLLKTDDSPVAKLLKARYYPNSSLLNAEVGARPSYSWRSMWGVRDIIVKGSRWLIGNGASVSVSLDSSTSHI